MAPRGAIVVKIVTDHPVTKGLPPGTVLAQGWTGALPVIVAGQSGKGATLPVSYACAARGG